MASITRRNPSSFVGYPFSQLIHLQQPAHPKCKQEVRATPIMRALSVDVKTQGAQEKTGSPALHRPAPAQKTSRSEWWLEAIRRADRVVPARLCGKPSASRWM